MVPECQNIKRVGYNSMALNALVDSFCHNQKKCGTKRVNQNGVNPKQRPLDRHLA